MATFKFSQGKEKKVDEQCIHPVPRGGTPSPVLILAPTSLRSSICEYQAVCQCITCRQTLDHITCWFKMILQNE